MEENNFLNNIIKSFEDNIETDANIYMDTLWHHYLTLQLSEFLHNQEMISDKAYGLRVLEKFLMRSRAKSSLLENIEFNYEQFKYLVNYLGNENIPIKERIKNSMGKNSKYGITQGGLYFVTQLLAGLNPQKYTVFHKQLVKSLHEFKIFDVSSNETPNNYYLFNQTCIEMFTSFRHKDKFNLSYVHNFLWHYTGDYKKHKQWARDVTKAYFYKDLEWKQFVVEFSTSSLNISVSHRITQNILNSLHSTDENSG